MLIFKDEQNLLNVIYRDLNIMKSVLFLLLLVVTVVVSNKLVEKNVDKIHMLLYSKQFRKTPSNFSIYDIPEEVGKFDKIFYVLHGWKRSAQMKEIQILKESILERLPGAGVILVNWENIASGNYYPLVAKNVKIVAQHLVSVWKSNKNLNKNAYIWCVGHSLGAHACGFAGKVFKIDQVTGLDPPSIGFQSYNHGLNHKSAVFVQVIHTTALAGNFLPRGHADFYPNGGHFQPFCKFTAIYCNHEYSILYFAQSFKKNMVFHAAQCSRFVWHLWRCVACKNCKMGYPADPQTRGLFYVNPKITQEKV